MPTPLTLGLRNESSRMIILIAVDIGRALNVPKFVGPAPTGQATPGYLEQAVSDRAILFSVADVLVVRGIPFIFWTGMTPRSFPHASYSEAM